MKLLLDENLSPTLIHLLAAKDVAAEHVARIGRSGATDPELWRLAFDRDAVIATINARDFLTLAAGSLVHPGLIVLRTSGLSRREQWLHLEPAVDFCLREETAGRDLINRVLEVRGIGNLDIYALP